MKPTAKRVAPQRILDDLADSALSFDALAQWLVAFNPHTNIPELKRLIPSLTQAEIDDADAILAFRYHTLNADGTLSPKPYVRAKVYWKPLEGFAAQHGKDARGKYRQPAGTPVEVYWPPNIDWRPFMADPITPLVVVEGEKKALSLASRGVYAVGLGGVNSIAPGKNGGSNRNLPLCPELALASAGREITYVVFDVDSGHAAMKPQVKAAAFKLCGLLLNMDKPTEARISILRRAPGVPITQKWTVEDLVKRADARKGPDPILDELELCATPNYIAQRMFELDQQYIYCAGADAILHRKTRVLMKDDNFRRALDNHKIRIPVMSTSRSGAVAPSGRTKDYGEGSYWLCEYGGRPTGGALDLFPGEDRVEMPDGSLNKWPGFRAVNTGASRAQSIKDVEPWRAELRRLHGSDAPLVEQIYLWPLAFPERGKMQIIMVLQSPRQGVGKSFGPEKLAQHVYGDATSEPLTDKELKSDFNEWAQTTFALFDDTGSLFSMHQKLNGLATMGKIPINSKGRKPYKVSNYMNMVITTNHSLPLRLARDERRYYLPHICEDVMPSDYWDKYRNWFEQERGGDKILTYAQHMREDAKYWEGFDPKMRAPLTAKAEEMREGAESDASIWLRTEFLPKALRDVVAISEVKMVWRVYTEFHHISDRNSADSALLTAWADLKSLTNFAVREIEVPLPSGKRKKLTLYAIRNQPKWEALANDKWRSELQRARAVVDGAKPWMDT